MTCYEKTIHLQRSTKPIFFTAKEIEWVTFILISDVSDDPDLASFILWSVSLLILCLQGQSPRYARRHGQTIWRTRQWALEWQYQEHYTPQVQSELVQGGLEYKVSRCELQISCHHQLPLFFSAVLFRMTLAICLLVLFSSQLVAVPLTSLASSSKTHKSCWRLFLMDCTKISTGLFVCACACSWWMLISSWDFLFGWWVWLVGRVKDKAYKELSDSDGRPDEEVAKEAWDYHLSRNQSIIVDLFQGQVEQRKRLGGIYKIGCIEVCGIIHVFQLKSEVTCKTCQYTSVRFDPFTFLSLPLPMDSTVNLEVIGEWVGDH